MDTRPRKILFEAQEGEKFISRDIIVVDGYAFYRSSGHSSDFAGIWFPMLYFSEESKAKRKTQGFAMPPAAYLDSKDPFPEKSFGSASKLTQHLDSLVDADGKKPLYRFGNLTALCISYAIDPKSWDNFIEANANNPNKHHYAKQLKKIKDIITTQLPFKNTISEIQKRYVMPSGEPDIYFNDFNIDAVEFNRGLRSMGQRYFANETFPAAFASESTDEKKSQKEIKQLSDESRIDYKKMLQDFLEELIPKAKGKGQKPGILQKCQLALQDGDYDFDRAWNLFQIILQTALQKRPNRSFFSTSLGNSALKLLKNDKHKKLREIFISPDDNIELDDLRIFATGGSNSKNDFRASEQAFTQIEAKLDRAHSRRKM